jgi:uncharacterized protein YkuJ
MVLQEHVNAESYYPPTKNFQMARSAIFIRVSHFLPETYTSDFHDIHRFNEGTNKIIVRVTQVNGEKIVRVSYSVNNEIVVVSDISFDCADVFEDFLFVKICNDLDNYKTVLTDKLHENVSQTVNDILNVFLKLVKWLFPSYS